MRLRDSNMDTLRAQNRAFRKLISNKSEKITADTSKKEETQGTGDTPCTVETVEKPKEKPRFNPKDTGNNHTRRKAFFDIETVIEDVCHDDLAFDREKSKVCKHRQRLRANTVMPNPSCLTVIGL